MQTIISEKNAYNAIEGVLRGLSVKKYLLVCDAAFRFLCIRDYFDTFDIPHVVFDGFTSNPLYEDVCRGVDLFRGEKCDAIVAVGGGSAIDVAKCIKLYCKMDPARNYLKQEMADSGVPLIAVPTTAGTGSESTRHAVIYFEGVKQSISHDSIVPNFAVLDARLLATLPIYQKKCTMMDALCQGIESWWSVHSTSESKVYSATAVQTIMRYGDAYLKDNDKEAAAHVLLAANFAGRAINITQTTAAHAMSYKLTSLYGLPHGHAVAVCLPPLWDYMIGHPTPCIDPRGADYVQGIFAAIAVALGCADGAAAVRKLRGMLRDLELKAPAIKEEDLSLLAASVHPTRLKNNPIALGSDTLLDLYKKVRDGN